MAGPFMAMSAEITGIVPASSKAIAGKIERLRHVVRVFMESSNPRAKRGDSVHETRPRFSPSENL